jgi:hypothetical protein
MDQQLLLIVMAVFVGVAAAALLVQMVTMLVLFFSVRKLQGQITGLLPEIQAIISVSRRTVEKAEVHVNKIGTTSVSILDLTKTQAHKIDELLNDVTTRAKVQVERAEMVLDDTMGRVQETVSIVQRTVLRPVREIYGIVSGLRTGLAYLGRGTRPTVDHATSDEEMFI